MSENNALSKFLTLANPLHMLTSLDKDYVIKNPVFSKNTGLNEAIGNTLVVGGLALPATFVVASLVNRLKHKGMLKAIDKSALKSLNSTKPVITPNSDLKYMKNLDEDAKNELAQVNELIEKHANEGNAAQTTPVDAKVHDDWSGALLAGLPVFALPFATYIGAKLANKVVKEDIKADLEDRAKKMKDYQDAVDMDILKKIGLVKEATKFTRSLSDGYNKAQEILVNLKNKTKEGVKAVQEGVSDAINEAKDPTKKLLRPLVTVPVAASTLTLLATAFGGAALLNKVDKNRKKVKFVKDKMLGENRSYETPEIALEFLKDAAPVEKEEVKQQIESLPAAALIENKEPLMIENNLTDNYDLLNDLIVPAGAKKDALF